MKTHQRLIAVSTLALALAAGAEAKAPASTKKAPSPRDVEVDTVKDAYWNRTAEGDVEVVQNRQYSKLHRLSLRAEAGAVSSDPYLSVKSVGGAVGFHFTESLGVSAIYRKFVVGKSSYYDELKKGLVTNLPSDANTNEPSSFIGGELSWSPLYGKISLSGSSIVHYDAHLLLGAGMTDTETGSSFTPTVGLGPEFYLGNSVALRLDYRLAIYKESIPDKISPATRAIAGDRTNYSHMIALGLELFL
jgi:outer membrane beta-barrel protein